MLLEAVEGASAQLYICATIGGRESTNREPVTFGQASILLPVIRAGSIDGVLVFNHASGGKSVFVGTIRNKPIPPASLGETIKLFDMVWV